MRYWIIFDHQLHGPYDKFALRAIPQFSLEMSVCPEGSEDWRAAKLFPDLTNSEPAPQIIQSGDYQPDDPFAGRRVTDWREAIIPSDVEERKIRFRAPAPSLAYSSPTPTPETEMARSVSARGKSKSNGHSTWTMVTLWTVFFGLYIPKTSQVDRIVDGLIANRIEDSALHCLDRLYPIARMKRLGQPNHKTIHPINKPGPAAPPTAHPAKPSRDTVEIVEEDSVDLGDGLQVKTVLSVDESNGKKIWKTRRYLRSKPGGRFEPL